MQPLPTEIAERIVGHFTLPEQLPLLTTQFRRGIQAPEIVRTARILELALRFRSFESATIYAAQTGSVLAAFSLGRGAPPGIIHGMLGRLDVTRWVGGMGMQYDHLTLEQFMRLMQLAPLSFLRIKVHHGRLCTTIDLRDGHRAVRYMMPAFQ